MDSTQHLSIVILAAGQGTRMKSAIPKVLHPLAKTPLLQHVINTSKELKPAHLHIVYGHGGELVKTTITDPDISWNLQAEQLGTGHAVAQATPDIPDDNNVLILYGDVPLTSLDTLSELLLQTNNNLALLTVHLDNPTGYGRIVRNKHGQVECITEEKDASDEVKKITEVNTGILSVKASMLKDWISRLDNNNAQNEYYLTDVIAMAVADGVDIKTTHPSDFFEVMGVNSRSQLAELERYYQSKHALRLMAEGVTLLDPERIDVRGKLSTGKDVTIDTNVIFEGNVCIGDNVTIGANSIIINSNIDDNVEILPMSIIEDSKVGSGTRIGPFARLRPGTELHKNTHIGNFVEIKNSEINDGSKVNHLSYIGDTSIGTNVNVGAGTITCNYDGAYKHRTIIEDDVFVGSDTQLVAPVTVGKGATIAAGTTVTTEVEAGVLAISRTKQKTISGWKRPTKDKS